MSESPDGLTYTHVDLEIIDITILLSSDWRQLKSTAMSQLLLPCLLLFIARKSEDHGKGKNINRTMDIQLLSTHLIVSGGGTSSSRALRDIYGSGSRWGDGVAGADSRYASRLDWSPETRPVCYMVYATVLCIMLTVIYKAKRWGWHGRSRHTGGYGYWNVKGNLSADGK